MKPESKPVQYPRLAAIIEAIIREHLEAEAKKAKGAA